MSLKVYGIGNTLIDIFSEVSDSQLTRLSLHKGTMHLIDPKRRSELISFIKSSSANYSCGGSAPNTLVTLSYFGVLTALAGKIGKDKYGKIYEEKLSELDIISELKTCDNYTGSSIILITPDSERTMNTFLAANREFSEEDINPELIAKADYFYFTGYMWDTKNQKGAILKAIEIAEANNTKIVFDVADPFAVSRNREDFLGLIRDHAYIAFANNEEARILFDNYDAGECAKSMGKLCPVAVVKNGKQGSYIFTDSKLLSVPVKGKAPVDTTGAGDTYAAGFILGLCREFSLYDSGLLASFLAGEVVQQHGAQFSNKKAEELNILLDSGKWRSM
ncbi:MAG: adenosine kinase [Spirochaetota bacterium]|nr:adenosine kinase [Spirochaetota bacterium]